MSCDQRMSYLGILEVGNSGCKVLSEHNLMGTCYLGPKHTSTHTKKHTLTQIFMDTDGVLFILYYLHYTKGSNTTNTYFMTNNLPIQIFRLNPEQ